MKYIYTILLFIIGFTTSVQAQFVAKSVIKTKPNIDFTVLKSPAKTSSGLTAEKLVGDYQAYGISAFQGGEDEEWQVSITQDNDNPNMLWIHPICYFGGLEPSDIKPVYAIFDQVTSCLQLPLGQNLFGSPLQTYNMVIATYANGNPQTSGSMYIDVTQSKNEIKFTTPNLLGVGNINADEWWYQAFSSITFTMEKRNDPVYVYVIGEEKPISIENNNVYFPIVDEVAYVSDAPAISEEINNTYSAIGISGLNGGKDENWEVTITQDPADPNKIWISPIFNFAGLPESAIEPVYAIYDKNNEAYNVPLGQTLYGGANQDYHIVLAGSDDSGNPIISGSMKLSVSYNGISRILLFENFIGCGCINNDIWWYQGMYIMYHVGSTTAIPVERVEKISKTYTEVENTEIKWVDLGLPSGALWAKYNIGADSEEEVGDYFAWGECYTKDEYSESTYFDSNNNFFNGLSNKSLIGTEYDTATQLWGEDWVMPTREQALELYYECDWKWVSNYNKSGVSGCIVTGPNGNHIFMPAGGLVMETDLSWTTSGNIWIGELNYYNNFNWACFIDFTSNGPNFNYAPYEDDVLGVSQDYRWWGRNVRAVRR